MTLEADQISFSFSFSVPEKPRYLFVGIFFSAEKRKPVYSPPPNDASVCLSPFVSVLHVFLTRNKRTDWYKFASSKLQPLIG